MLDFRFSEHRSLFLFLFSLCTNRHFPFIWYTIYFPCASALLLSPVNVSLFRLFIRELQRVWVYASAYTIRRPFKLQRRFFLLLCPYDLIHESCVQTYLKLSFIQNEYLRVNC